MRNVVIQYALKLDGARGTALIFNDAKGHICRVQITPQLLTVRKDDHDRDGPDQGAILQALKTPIAPGSWHTVLIEIQGSEMLARIDGTAVAYGSNDGIDRDKTLFGLVVLGASASFKDLVRLGGAAEPRVGLHPRQARPLNPEVGMAGPRVVRRRVADRAKAARSPRDPGIDPAKSFRPIFKKAAGFKPRSQLLSVETRRQA